MCPTASVSENVAQTFEGDACVAFFLGTAVLEIQGMEGEGLEKVKLSFSKDVYNVTMFSSMVGYKINILKVTAFQHTSHKQARKYKYRHSPENTSLVNIFLVKWFDNFNIQTLQNISLSIHSK